MSNETLQQPSVASVPPSTLTGLEHSAEVASVAGLLLRAQRAVGDVAKNGKATNYDYAKYEDIIRAISKACGEAGLPSTMSTTGTGFYLVKTSQYTTRMYWATVQLAVFCPDTGQWMRWTSQGLGMDSGDKGINKAVTQAAKNVLRLAFNVATGVDTEAVETPVIDDGAGTAFDKARTAALSTIQRLPGLRGARATVEPLLRSICAEACEDWTPNGLRAAVRALGAHWGEVVAEIANALSVSKRQAGGMLWDRCQASPLSDGPLSAAVISGAAHDLMSNSDDFDIAFNAAVAELTSQLDWSADRAKHEIIEVMDLETTITLRDAVRTVLDEHANARFDEVKNERLQQLRRDTQHEALSDD